jgi:hypothetical protein
MSTGRRLPGNAATICAMNRDDMDLAKAVAEGTVSGLTQSFHEIVVNLLGRVSIEIGDELGDMARRWRANRGHRIATRAIEIIDAAGAPRRPVPAKVLIPALEHASLEDDEELQERWAILIANAANRDAQDVSRTYVEVLKELTPRDAKLLEWICDHPPELDRNDPSFDNKMDNPPRRGLPPRVERRTVVTDFGLADEDFELVCSRLERLGLCDIGRYVVPTRMAASGTGPRRYDSIQLRPLGVALVQACRLR